MTILVGIRCKDGIVIGADGSATFAAGEVRTIEQPTKKLQILFDQIIIAGTGQIGLGQRFFRLFETSWGNANTPNCAAIDACRNICSVAVKDFGSTGADKGQYGALVGFPFKGTYQLCEFAPRDFQPELKTDDLWYVSMGSAQPIVDPFLGLMRKVFWRDGAPTHQDAIFAVTWALEHAVDVNPGGVNHPIQIALLTKQANGNPNARLLGEDELLEHKNNVEAAQDHLRGYADILRGADRQAVPDIPRPAE